MNAFRSSTVLVLALAVSGLAAGGCKKGGGSPGPGPSSWVVGDDGSMFRLTDGQIRVGDEITADLARDHPMHRLLQGEVGTGKTVVALRAMLAVVDTGGQAALLAPTEVLAQQHHRSLTELMGPLAERGLLGGFDVGTRVALLTGSMAAAAV